MRAGYRFEMRNYRNALDDYNAYIQLAGEKLAETYFMRCLSQIALESFIAARADLEMSRNLDSTVIKAMFETADDVSEFIEVLALKSEVPADLLALLKPVDEA